jgi:hypothetical protein
MYGQKGTDRFCGPLPFPFIAAPVAAQEHGPTADQAEQQTEGGQQKKPQNRQSPPKSPLPAADILAAAPAAAMQTRHRPVHRLNRLLNRRLFRHAGKLSLSIYVNHALICRFIQGFLSSRLTLAHLSQCLLYFALLTAYSIFTLILVEKLHALYKRTRK